MDSSINLLNWIMWVRVPLGTHSESSILSGSTWFLIVPDVTNLGDIVIQTIRLIVLAYLTKGCEHLKRTNKAINSRIM